MKSSKVTHHPGYDGTAFSTVEDEIEDASGRLDTAEADIVTLTTGLATRYAHNYLINGAMMVSQRNTSYTSTGGANNDDVYVLDRWNLLSDGNDIVDVTRATDVPTGGLYSMGLDVETVDKKFGILQVVEQKDCIGLIGSTVTLSAYLRVTNATRLDKIKMGVLAWSSTADTVTSDIVSAWNVDGTNPTLVANWTYENTPADLGVTTSWARYSVTAAVDTASTTNIGVFIWSDNVTDTDLADFLYVTDVQLELGAVATAFDRRGYGDEFSLCQRYYQKTYNDDVVPGTSTSVGARTSMGGNNNTTGAIDFPFATRMRATPTTVTFYSTNDGASGNIFDAAGANRVATLQASGMGGVACSCVANADGHLLSGQMVAQAEL
jgi:hypothetical protein